jgi:tRNA threonylcarbamoyladenosine biosynthesis protein TsaE
MKMPVSASVFLASEEETSLLGQWFAAHLGAGDALLLQGPIGAGKSHLARALIRARLGRMEDVPSPTFTLVQTYQADIEIWHADLYRLSHPDEVLELGLDEAFSTAICLIEWPDRLGSLAPETALRLELSSEAEGRRAVLSGLNVGFIAQFAMDWPA